VRLLRLTAATVLAIACGSVSRARLYALPSAPPPPPPVAHAPHEMRFIATAYCQHGKTASGAHTSHGIAAADLDVLPIGTRIRVSGLKRGRDGIYRVMDTGTRVQGRRVDLFMPSCAEARRFGRQHVTVVVVR